MPTTPDLVAPWAPLPVPSLVERMQGAPFFWCLAGGQAIARVVGRSYRAHQDLDIVVLRSDQSAVHEWLANWHLYAADPPGSLRPWTRGETLPSSTHDVWCHRAGSRSWELQIMIQESDGVSWTFRRDARICGKVEDLAAPVAGVPCLRMDLQLLFKAKDVRPKDHLDFSQLLPALPDTHRGTLVSWLRLTHPGHPWLDALAA